MIKINIGENLNVEIEGFDTFKATAPFSDFGQLIKLGKIENPLTCKNAEKTVSCVEPKVMKIKGIFSLTKEQLKYDHISIQCNKIDALCSCYINSKLAFRSKNAHIPIDFDVKPLLQEGINSLKIEIYSSVDYITKKQSEKKLPKNNNGIDGAAYIRKASCHFGWDWGPCIPYKFIDKIELCCYNKKIDNIIIKQKIKDNIANIAVSAINTDEIYLITPEGIKLTGKDGKFVIENPRLWWTHDISQTSKQPLYTVVLKNNEMTVERKIGLRSIKLNQSKDEYGYNFQFVLNGEPVFSKGACVIPFAAIPEDADNSKIDYYLDLCIKSNFNMIRIWGGGEYASDYLLNRCDELGILIWQDFCYACLMYPFYEPDFYENCIDEAVFNVKRTEHHPCLALWCGNNELEAMFSYLPKNSQIMKSYVDFFYNKLPQNIKGITDIDYIPTSPLGDKPFIQNTSDNVGDTHMWNVWHGLKPLDYYEKRYTRFMSEFGLESLPSLEAIKTFAQPDEFDLKSNAFMSHQKCVGGNEKMMFYLKSRFDTPKHFEDLPYLTGIVQAECVKSATEHFRRNKGRCNGALFWQLNDVWCCPSWSAVDFLGKPKVLMFSAKHFCAPIGVSYSNGYLYFFNDTIFENDISVEITVINGVKTLTQETVQMHLPKNSVTEIKTHRLEKNDVLKVTLNGNDFYFDRVQTLKNADISAKIEKGFLILKSNEYARYVFIDDEQIEDNYFNLLPFEEKKIKYSKNTIPEIKCENNIEFSKRKLKTSLQQLVYRLKPMNIANAFYYEYN